ncbi:MAG: TauD/TfdA family dioxygenase [Pseudomonadota bacterium]
MGLKTLEIEPLATTFGARVRNIRISEIDDDTFRALYQAWLDYALLIFTDQFMTRDEQIAFARRFGDLEFDIAPLSNVLGDGSLRRDDDSDDVIKVLKGNMGWHHDSTYMPIQAKGAVFTAEVVPQSGGATGFADMRAAYDALDGETKQKIGELRAHHSLYHSQAKVGHNARQGSHGKEFKQDGAYSGYGFHDGPISVRPLVKVHPETGRPNLLVGRHAYDIVGMVAEESETLLKELVEFACQPPRVYHHDWQVGDALVWDNRRLMHQATPWPMDQARVMWHSRIAGDRESEAALSN